MISYIILYAARVNTRLSALRSITRYSEVYNIFLRILYRCSLLVGSWAQGSSHSRVEVPMYNTIEHDTRVRTMG